MEGQLFPLHKALKKLPRQASRHDTRVCAQRTLADQFALSHPEVQKFKPTALKLAKQYVLLLNIGVLTYVDNAFTEYGTVGPTGVRCDPTPTASRNVHVELTIISYTRRKHYLQQDE